MQTLTIAPRKQWGKYLNDQAREIAKLRSERDELRELVADAYALRERMPRSWVNRAKVTLYVIKE